MCSYPYPNEFVFKTDFDPNEWAIIVSVDSTPQPFPVISNPLISQRVLAQLFKICDEIREMYEYFVDEWYWNEQDTSIMLDTATPGTFKIFNRKDPTCKAIKTSPITVLVTNRNPSSII